MKLLKSIPLFFSITFISLLICGTLSLFMFQNSSLSLAAIWDVISLILICTGFLVYNIAFYTKENNSIKILNYKLNWLSEIFILMAILGTLIGFYLMISGMEIPPEAGVDPTAMLGGMVAVSLITIIYGFIYAFSTNIYKKSLVDYITNTSENNHNINTKENFRIGATISLILFIIIWVYAVVLISRNAGLNNSIIITHNLYYLLLLLLLLPAIYKGKSFLNLFTSWFWYFKEEDEIIRYNIKYLTSVKKTVSIFYCLSFLITPMLIYGGIYFGDNSPFYPLQNAVYLFFFGGVYILILTIMQGQQVNKLFINTGEIIETDKFFALKFYLIPIFIIYLYFSFCVVLGFVVI